MAERALLPHLMVQIKRYSSKVPRRRASLGGGEPHGGDCVSAHAPGGGVAGGAEAGDGEGVDAAEAEVAEAVAAREDGPVLVVTGEGLLAEGAGCGGGPRADDAEEGVEV